MSPLVSIVTASLNQGEYIERCIESVKENRCSDIEHIIVDGGSSDRTEDVLSRYCDDPRLIIIRGEDDGPADALNKGFARSSGDVLGYINADDYYRPGALDTAVSHLRVGSSRLIYGHGVLVDRWERKIKPIYSDRWRPIAYACRRCNIVQQATFFTRDAWNRCEGFNTNNTTCWDGELLVSLWKCDVDFTRVDAYLGAFRAHAGSISSGSSHLREYHATRERLRREIASYVGLDESNLCTTRWADRRRFRDPGIVVRRASSWVRGKLWRLMHPAEAGQIEGMDVV